MKEYVYMDMNIRWSGKKWTITTVHGTMFGSADSIQMARKMIKTDRLLKEKQ